MRSFETNVCAVCGGLRSAPSRWFLVTENRWEDKLKILRWSDGLAAKWEFHHVCSPSHARELVIHWMTTGSLNYPFARTAPSLHWKERRSNGMLPERDAVEISANRIGELSVHRESVKRALTENPQALNAILDELSIVLRREAGGAPNDVEAEDEMFCARATEM